MKLSIVSPVHIGNGRELTVVDFVPLNERLIAVLDLERLVEKLMQINAEVDEVLEVLRNPEMLPDEYIWKHVLDKYGVNVEDVRRYTLPVVGRPGNRSMRIREFIKVRGKPYIPGSSVKGAIRTAVFCHVAREHYEELSGLLDTLAKRGAKKTKADDRLEAEVFGYREQYRNGRKFKVYEPKNDPMRALIVRDSKPFGLKHLRLYSVSTVGGKKDIPNTLKAWRTFRWTLKSRLIRSSSTGACARATSTAFWPIQSQVEGNSKTSSGKPLMNLQRKSSPLKKRT